MKTTERNNYPIKNWYKAYLVVFIWILFSSLICLFVYYKENEWYLSLESDIPYKVGTYILSIDAFIKDAKAHNEIFLNILKEGFKVSKID